MDLNKAQIIWRVTQDIELKNTPNGQNVTSFWVATNRNWKDASWNKQEQVEFHNVVLWGKLAEIAGQYVQKWNKVYIEWRLQTRNWEWQDWVKRYSTEIVWENMIMLWGKWGDTQMWEPSQAQYNSNNTPNSSPSSTKTEPKQEDEISIEDLPF